MNGRFPLLSFVASLLVWVGVALILAGIAGVVANLGGDTRSSNIFFAVICGASGIGGGLILIATSELVGVSFAIEESARRSAEALERIAKAK